MCVAIDESLPRIVAYGAVCRSGAAHGSSGNFSHRHGFHARECAPLGITANCVRPGWIDRSTKHAAAPAEIRAQALREIALGRTGTPEDVAGATIDVNGGLYMG